MPKSINLKSLFLTFLFILSLQFLGKAAPICNCEDFPTQDEVEDCIANNYCEGYDIPVNGNVWLLVVGGIALFAVQSRIWKKS